MIEGTSSKPMDIPGGGKNSSYNRYIDLKKNKMLDLLTDNERLELLANAIEEIAGRDLKSAKELYFKDFKDLDCFFKNFHKKNLESLLEIKKSN